MTQPFAVDVFSYQDMIDAGLMIGPRAFSTGSGIFVNCEISSLADARALLTRYRDHYRTRNIKALAEREGFEPSERLRAQRFSRPPRSTTPAPLRM